MFGNVESENAGQCVYREGAEGKGRRGTAADRYTASFEVILVVSSLQEHSQDRDEAGTEHEPKSALSFHSGEHPRWICAEAKLHVPLHVMPTNDIPNSQITLFILQEGASVSMATHTQ